MCFKLPSNQRKQNVVRTAEIAKLEVDEQLASNDFSLETHALGNTKPKSYSISFLFVLPTLQASDCQVGTVISNRRYGKLLGILIL